MAQPLFGWLTGPSGVAAAAVACTFPPRGPEFDRTAGPMPSAEAKPMASGRVQNPVFEAFEFGQ